MSARLRLLPPAALLAVLVLVPAGATPASVAASPSVVASAAAAKPKPKPAAQKKKAALKKKAAQKKKKKAAQRKQARRKRCKPGTVGVRAGRRVVCRKLGGPVRQPSAALLKSVRARLLGTSLKPRKGRRVDARTANRVRRAVLSPTAQRALLRGLAVAKAPTGARAAAAGDDVRIEIDQDVPGGDGWKVHVSGTATRSGADAAVDVTATAAKRVDGVDVTVSVRQRADVGVDRCPDVRGVVRGSGMAEVEVVAGGRMRGHGSVRVTGTYTSRAAIEAHVAGDAHWTDFDQRQKTSLHIQVVWRDGAGRVVATNPPDLKTLRLEATGIKRGAGSRAIFGRLRFTDAHATGGGFVKRDGEVLYHGDDASSAIDLAMLQFIEIAGRIDQALDITDRYTPGWSDGYSCVTVEASAAKTELRPGESTEITFTVKPPAGQSALAEGRYAASGRVGSVAPANGPFGEQALTVTYTAPTAGWSEGKTDSIGIEATSRQGVGHGWVDVRAARAPPADHHFKVTAIGGGYEMAYSHTNALPPCTVTGSERYAMTIDPGAERGVTDGHVSERTGYGTVWLPTMVDGAQDYASAPCDDTAGHVANPCHGPIEHVSRLLDALTIEHEPGAATATVTLTAPGTIGYVVPLCPQWFHDGGEIYWRDHPKMTAVVAWSTVTGTRPFTVSVEDAWDYDPDRTVARTRSVTLAPVDEQGRPLG